MTISNQITTAIANQGRKISWLAKELAISRTTLYSRIEHDNWSELEISKLKKLNLLQ